MGEASPKLQQHESLLGRVINDRYRIVATIARGGMGKVYRAEQMPLGREVALKVLDPKHTGDSDPEFHKRFFLEASTAAKLSHPNTVTIFDYGHTTDGIYFIAMELVDGRTLSSILKKEGPMAPQRAVTVAMQICRSLREAHGLGVIHRDLKPANVLLTRHADEEDFVKVLDFGLVKDVQAEEDDLTKAGVFMGSPKYMSPEQIQGGEIDGRSDVYSLGVILYQLLSGDVPFEGGTPVQTLMMHMREPAPPLNQEGRPHVSPALEQVVMRCLEKRPEDRFGSMNELLVALKQAGATLGIPVAGLSSTQSAELAVSGMRPAGEGLGVTPSGVLTPSIGMAAPSGSGPALAEAAEPAIDIDVIDAELERRSGRGWIALAVVALLAAAGGAWALWGGERAEPAQASAVAEPAPEPEPETAPAAESERSEPAERAEAAAVQEGPVEPAPAAHRVLVTLRSNPSGATVHVGDAQYGPTPAQIEWIGEEAEPGREVELRFELAGHRPETVTRTIEGGELEVEATLQRRVPRWRPGPRPTPMDEPTPMGDPVRLPGDYLNSPY